MISISYLNGDGKCPTGPSGLKVPANFSAYRLLSTLIQLYTSGRFSNLDKGEAKENDLKLNDPCNDLYRFTS